MTFVWVVLLPCSDTRLRLTQKCKWPAAPVHNLSVSLLQKIPQPHKRSLTLSTAPPQEHRLWPEDLCSSHTDAFTQQWRGMGVTVNGERDREQEGLALRGVFFPHLIDPSCSSELPIVAPQQVKVTALDQGLTEYSFPNATVDRAPDVCLFSHIGRKKQINILFLNSSVFINFGKTA